MGTGIRASALALATAVLASPAMAQDGIPGLTRPVTVVVGYTPGSGMDVLARFIADQLAKRTNHKFIVENRPGAFAMLSAGHVARAEPDGHTILVHTSAMAIYPHIFVNVPYGSGTAFRAATTIGKSSAVLVVNPEAVPVNSVADLTAYVKARPGTVTSGSGNSTVEIATALYKKLADLDTVNVRYQGVPQAFNDLLGGRIQYMFVDSLFAMPLVRAGRLKALGVATANRITFAPEVPTMVEAGIAGYEDLSGWQAVLLPPNTPLSIRDAYARQINAIMASDDGRATLTKLGLEPFPSTPEATDTYFAQEIEKWGKLVKIAGIKPE
jgi:tripartite-type tricarboxylate transporter receptor subunit TctC